MRVILSRKGFDSANGGIVSPIINGMPVSFPIPSNDANTFDQLFFGEHTYAQILGHLGYKGVPTCHVDPDLDATRRTPIKDWKPIFGQIGAASGYLLKTVGVQVGDIIPFFGNFHWVEYVDGKYRYVKNSGDFYKDHDIQLIWGYMQIGQIVTDPEEQKKYKWHPHAVECRTEDGTNVMFIAADHLSFAPDMPGAGLLPFSEHRVLTAYGCNKATWKQNDVYDVHNVIGNRKNSSKVPGTIYYAGIWQEMGLEISEECEEWMKYIILGGTA